MLKGNTSHSNFQNIDDLPDEILEYVLTLVSQYRDLDACRLVNRRWLRITNSVCQHTRSNLYRSLLNSNVVWHSVPSQDSSPTITKRYSHSAVYYDSLMYVFGGCTTTSTTFNDLWMLDLTTRQWVRPFTTGNYPSPKACATMCYYKKMLVLFGGWTHPPPYPLHQTLRLFNELHTYDIISNKWDVIHTTSSPPAMAGHSASIHGDTMVVFGGKQKTNSISVYNTSSDIWCLSLETHNWKKQDASDPKPSPRYGQSQMYLDDTHLLIIGGCGGPVLIHDDVWLLTMEGPVWQWTKVRIINSQWSAPHMWCHQACRIGGLVVVFSRSFATQSLVSSGPPRDTAEPQDAAIPPEVVARQASQTATAPPRDRNVNGHHGVLPRGTSSTDLEQPVVAVKTPGPMDRPRELQPHCSSSPRYNDLQMAAFRDDIRSNPHSSKNRMRQLESLRRIEARYKSIREDVMRRKKASETAAQPTNNSVSRINMYVLEIDRILSEDPCVTWRQPSPAPGGPRDTILYSVVVGKGELVVFGGIQKDPTAVATVPILNLNFVSNNIHFVSPPKNII